MTDRPASAPPFVGILGGMGPLAGIDFAEKLTHAATELFDAARDQDQVPFVLWSVPQVPDRVGPLLTGTGESPLPAMARGVAALNGLGVDIIAIACNTAHAWHGDLAADSRAPIPHIAEAATQAVSALPGVSCVGIVGTAATLEIGLYQRPLERAGLAWLTPGPRDIDALVKPAISLVKQGRSEDATGPALQVCERLVARGANAIVLACTELPVALDPAEGKLDVHVIDPARALARACLRWR
jgi:aspartate racemase